MMQSSLRKLHNYSTPIQLAGRFLPLMSGIAQTLIVWFPKSLTDYYFKGNAHYKRFIPILELIRLKIKSIGTRDIDRFHAGLQRILKRINQENISILEHSIEHFEKFQETGNFIYFQLFLASVGASLREIFGNQERPSGIIVVDDSGQELPLEESNDGNADLYFVMRVLARVGISYYLREKKINSESILKAENNLDKILEIFFQKFEFDKIAELLKNLDTQIGLYLLRNALNSKSTPQIIQAMDYLRKDPLLKDFLSTKDVFHNLAEIMQIMDTSYKGSFFAAVTKNLHYVLNPVLGFCLPIANTGINICYGIKNLFEPNKNTKKPLSLLDNQGNNNLGSNLDDEFEVPEAAGTNESTDTNSKSGNYYLKIAKKALKNALKFIVKLCKGIIVKTSEIASNLFKSCQSYFPSKRSSGTFEAANPVANPSIVPKREAAVGPTIKVFQHDTTQPRRSLDLGS